MPQLKLLGGALVEDEAGRAAVAASRRHPLALLAMLARASNATLSRSKLVGLLWPESSEKAARNRLGTCVHRVRKALGDGVIVSVGDALRLDREALHCDVCRFEEAIRDEDFETAVALYKGPFLDGFYLRGSVEFEHWLDAERDALRRQHWHALGSLAVGAESRGDPAGASGWWRRRLSEDPADTPVALRLVSALRAAGNPAEALRVGRAHRELLKEEFATEPGPAFDALLDELGRASGAVREGPPASTVLGPTRSLPRAELGRVPDRTPERQDPAGGEDAPRLARRAGSLLMLLGALSAAAVGVWYLAAAKGDGNRGSRGTVSDAAYELYQQGERLDQVRPKTLDVALRRAGLYARAVEIDPGFAAGWAGLADAQIGHAWFSTSADSRRAWADSARASARRALQLDPELSAAYTEIGDSYWVLGGHTDEQIEAYRRALELDPGAGEALNNLVVLLERSGRMAEAMRVVAAANDRGEGDPYLSSLVLENAALGRDSAAEQWLASARRNGATPSAVEFVYALLYRADTARAREALAATDRELSHVTRRRARAALALYAGDWREARRRYRDLYTGGEDVGSSVPTFVGLLSDAGGLAWSLHRLGNDDEAAEIARAMLARARDAIVPGTDSYLPRHRAAVALLILGDTTAALRQLDQSVAGGFRNVRVLRSVPTLDPVRHHPRFRDLLNRLDTLIAEQRHVVEEQGWGLPAAAVAGSPPGDPPRD